MIAAHRFVRAAALLLSVSAASAQPLRETGPGEAPGSIVGREWTGPATPAPRGQDGKPDLTGYWKGLIEKGKPIGNLGKDLPGFALPFTPAGLKARDYNRTKTIDPEALCILGGIPRHNASLLPFQVLHTPKLVGFLYLYSTHRFVTVDGRLPDPDPDPRYFGTAYGHWEGDTLVVETGGLHDSADGKIWADENGDPISDQARVVERWTRPDEHHIHLDEVVTDPKYFLKPVHFARTWVLGAPGEISREYACNENNIDAANLGPGPGPIGPDGNRGSGYDRKPLPAVPPPPEAYDPPPK